METSDGHPKENCNNNIVRPGWFVSISTSPTLVNDADIPSSFVAGLINTIVQTIYVTNPSWLVSGF